MAWQGRRGGALLVFLFGAGLKKNTANTNTKRISRLFCSETGIVEDLQMAIDRASSSLSSSHNRMLTTPMQNSARRPPRPFEMFDKPGLEEIVVRRIFGNEQISISCMLDTLYRRKKHEDIAKDREAGERHERLGDPIRCVRLMIDITKGKKKPVLGIEGIFYKENSEVLIEKVTYLAKDYAEEPEPYENPNFEDLDENLQRKFHDFLQARGITRRLSVYLLDYLIAKEQREYIRWLRNIQGFLKKGG